MLTVKELRALKPRKLDYNVSDRDGLSVRVFPNGRKSFQYRYKLPGWKTSKRYVYGDYPDTSLEEARELHEKARHKFKKGIDLNLEKKTIKLRQKADPTVKEAFIRYRKESLHVRLRRPERQIQYFEKDILPAIGEMKLKDVSKDILVVILKKIVDRPAPIQANRTLSALKVFYDWGETIYTLPENPTIRIKKKHIGGSEKPKNRFLTESEIKTFLEKIESAPFSRTVQLILEIQLLTGQRVGEVCNAEWSEIDFNKQVWTIPAEKAKNEIQNRVPLHGMTLECFQELKTLAVFSDPEPKDSRFVCQSPQVRKLVKGNRKSKNVINEIPIIYTTVNRAVKRHQDHFKIEKWVPHDLRRTVATHLNEMEILPHVVEKILNHKMQGVMAVYNKADYWPQRVEALKLWQEKIKQIIAGKKVVSIRIKEA